MQTKLNSGNVFKAINTWAASVVRLHLSKSESSRGLITVQDTVETGILGLRNYIRSSKERLLIAACKIEEDED